MANISGNLVKTSFIVREIKTDIGIVKELLKTILRREEKTITLTSADGLKIDFDNDKIECVEEYVKNEEDYISAKSIVYTVSSNFFPCKRRSRVY